MSIIVRTSRPQRLLKMIKRAIDNDEVVTWTQHDDGDFTHCAEQWDERAWLRPKVNVEEGKLSFEILFVEGEDDEEEDLEEEEDYDVVYGIYHGRFIEMLLTHFSECFSSVSATPIR